MGHTTRDAKYDAATNAIIKMGDFLPGIIIIIIIVIITIIIIIIIIIIIKIF